MWHCHWQREASIFEYFLEPINALDVTLTVKEAERLFDILYIVQAMGMSWHSSYWSSMLWMLLFPSRKQWGCLSFFILDIDGMDVNLAVKEAKRISDILYTGHWCYVCYSRLLMNYVWHSIEWPMMLFMLILSSRKQWGCLTFFILFQLFSAFNKLHIWYYLKVWS